MLMSDIFVVCVVQRVWKLLSRPTRLLAWQIYNGRSAREPNVVQRGLTGSYGVLRGQLFDHNTLSTLHQQLGPRGVKGRGSSLV